MREPSPYFIHRTARPEVVSTRDASLFFDQPEEGLDLRGYWLIIRRNLRLAIAVFFGALLLTGLRLSMMVPMYTARTTILIAPQEPNIVESRAVRSDGGTLIESDYRSTQCDILKSRTLAARVIRNLGLERGGVLIGKGARLPIWSRLLIGLQDAIGAAPAPSRAIERTPVNEDVFAAKPWLVDAYLAGLKITPVEDTSLVTIAFTSVDPKVSAQVANAHAREYIRQGIEIRGHADLEAEQFLRQKLVELKEQLEKSELALNDYRREKGIIPGLISLDGKDAVVLNRMADLSSELTKTRVESIGLEAQIQLIKDKKYDFLPAVMNNSLVQTLEGQRNELYTQQAALSQQFTPDYPPLKQIQAKISAIQDRLASEVRRVVDSIESAYREATVKENRLQQEMDRQRTLTLSLNDAAVQYAILQREVDTNRQLYDSVLKAMKDVGVLAEAQTSNVSVIDRAEAPGGPSSPKPLQALLFAAVLGMVGAIGAAFALDYLDNTFKTAEEAEQYLRLPTLAVVPEFTRVNGHKNGAGHRLSGAVAGEPSLGRELSSPRGYYSTMVEAYRSFRTALLLSRAGSPPKTTLITSAFPQEGKTVTAVNTAVMLAQLGSKVLLVDADLRRPRCHQFFAIDNDLGLAEVLTGTGNLRELLRATELNHLSLLAAGSAPPNPTELLGSSKMAETLKYLCELYDYVVIDSPPVMPVSDALLLATLVDGVALVADASHTPRQQIKAACARLEYARAKILGIVLNKANAQSHFYHYYGRYYATSPSDADRDARPL